MQLFPGLVELFCVLGDDLLVPGGAVRGRGFPGELFPVPVGAFIVFLELVLYSNW